MRGVSDRFGGHLKSSLIESMNNYPRLGRFFFYKPKIEFGDSQDNIGDSSWGEHGFLMQQEMSSTHMG